MVNFRIMVVEDDGIIALGLQTKLESWGYTVDPVVFSGEDAVKESYQRKPDLILMDIGVKGDLNGIEAAHRIKELDIPIIFITGLDDQSITRKAMETVPYALLKKPVNNDMLKHLIQSALEEKR
ncbi:MAG: response regulator [Methanobacterium sp.]|nr:response regulator [Methanobacterium sp.]